MSLVDEIQLADNLREGSAKAYETAIRTFYPWLRRVAQSYIGAEAIAEDIVDDVFTRVWEHRQRLAPGTRLGVYLLVAVRNASRDTARRQATVDRTLAERHPDEPLGVGGAPPVPDLALEHDELVHAVWNAVETLPERARMIMVLRWRHQASWSEIAEALEMSVAAAQMQHTRALRELRGLLADFSGGGD